ncbi:unnamed protein product [Dicrocoelium dendriticum]|nr:unnamed protein product [Dicrocoelium dendriticum]
MLQKPCSNDTEIYLIDRNGKRRASGDVFVPFNSHAKLSCTTNDTSGKLLWERQVPHRHTFVPVEESPFVSVEQSRDNELNLQLSKLRLSSPVTYRCRGPSSVQAVQLQVVGAIGSSADTVPIKKRIQPVGKYQFVIKHIDMRAQPTLRCHFAVGMDETNHTSITWRGGLYESNPELYESSEHINGGTTVSSSLKILKIVLDPRIFDRYECELKVYGKPVKLFEVQLVGEFFSDITLTIVRTF